MMNRLTRFLSVLLVFLLLGFGPTAYANDTDSAQPSDTPSASQEPAAPSDDAPPKQATETPSPSTPATEDSPSSKPTTHQDDTRTAAPSDKPAPPPAKRTATPSAVQDTVQDPTLKFTVDTACVGSTREVTIEAKNPVGNPPSRLKVVGPQLDMITAELNGGQSQTFDPIALESSDSYTYTVTHVASGQNQPYTVDVLACDQKLLTFEVDEKGFGRCDPSKSYGFTRATSATVTNPKYNSPASFYAEGRDSQGVTFTFDGTLKGGEPFTENISLPAGRTFNVTVTNKTTGQMITDSFAVPACLDTDGDGVPDDDDAFPDDPLESGDSDDDGVGDNADQCDNQAGPSSNHGCPVVTPPDECITLSSDNVATYGRLVWTATAATVSLKPGDYCNDFVFSVVRHKPVTFPQTVVQVDVGKVGESGLSDTASVSPTTCGQIDGYEGSGPSVGSQLTGPGQDYEANHKFLHQIFGGPNTWTVVDTGCDVVPPAPVVPVAPSKVDKCERAKRPTRDGVIIRSTKHFTYVDKATGRRFTTGFNRVKRSVITITAVPKPGTVVKPGVQTKWTFKLSKKECNKKRVTPPAHVVSSQPTTPAMQKTVPQRYFASDTGVASSPIQGNVTASLASSDSNNTVYRLLGVAFAAVFVLGWSLHRRFNRS